MDSGLIDAFSVTQWLQKRLNLAEPVTGHLCRNRRHSQAQHCMFHLSHLHHKLLKISIRAIARLVESVMDGLNNVINHPIVYLAVMSLWSHMIVAGRGPNFKTLRSTPFPGKTWVSNTKPSLLLHDPLIKGSKQLAGTNFL